MEKTNYEAPKIKCLQPLKGQKEREKVLGSHIQPWPWLDSMLAVPHVYFQILETLDILN